MAHRYSQNWVVDVVHWYISQSYEVCARILVPTSPPLLALPQPTKSRGIMMRTDKVNCRIVVRGKS
ncbi:hypothetical protein Hanom_Chr05g00433411 [Helianthus anomalus]